MFRTVLPQGQNLTGGNYDMAAQSTWIEFQVHFSIERTREVALDNHAAKPFSASDFDLRSELLVPIQFNRVVVPVIALAPGDGYTAIWNR